MPNGHIIMDAYGSPRALRVTVVDAETRQTTMRRIPIETEMIIVDWEER